MKKYRIIWDAGYGQSSQIIEAENQDEADTEAYYAWLEEAQNNADYSTELVTNDSDVEDE